MHTGTTAGPEIGPAIIRKHRMATAQMAGTGMATTTRQGPIKLIATDARNFETEVALAAAVVSPLVHETRGPSVDLL